MKLKKDAVRISILDAAKKEFFEKGYADSNMRSIAAAANVTPGNIYRYYDSKEDLLDAIVGTVSKKVVDITKLKGKLPIEKLSNKSGLMTTLLNYVFEVINKYRIEIIILFNRSQGSKYEGLKEQLIEFTTQSIYETMQSKDHDLAKVYGTMTIETELFIINNHLNEPVKIKELSMAFLTNVFSISDFSEFTMKE